MWLSLTAEDYMDFLVSPSLPAPVIPSINSQTLSDSSGLIDCTDINCSQSSSAELADNSSVNVFFGIYAESDVGYSFDTSAAKEI